VGGVIGPLTRGEPERSAPHHIDKRQLLVAPAELERGAERVADRKPDERADGTVADGRVAPIGQRFRLGCDRSDMSQLGRRLDRPGPHVAHRRDCRLGVPAELDQQPRRDRAGAAEPALAVNEDGRAIPQLRAKRRLFQLAEGARHTL
jgi:hypothetical protein